MILQQYQQLKDIINTYLPPEQIARIDHAFTIASNAHEGQFRAGGEPYITHPVTVACTLAKYHLDYETIMAGILHDVVEDTPITMAQLQKLFGNNVANLVAGVTKLDKLQFANYKEAQVANLHKMVMAMVQDIRVIIIKLADRMHNIQTLKPLRPDKRRCIAKETLEIYTPIANRLGMHAIKDKLEALCFENIFPYRCSVMTSAVSKAIENRKSEIEQITREVTDELAKKNIKGRVFCREISVFNIYRKLQAHKLEFHNILDNYCFTVIVNDVDTCYRVIGIIHNLYKPKPKTFKDYIAVPKSNGYQSIHTALIGPHGMPIEMLVRTEFMNVMSEMGVLARWSYNTADDQSSSAVMQQAQRWMNNLLELQENAGNAFEFVETVKDDLFPDEIYVFTPEGNILELPAGSTPIDFAYAIHTDIGQTCIGARVDHQPYPLSRKLKSGQSVEIITSPNGRPNTSWLNFVVTSRARSKIKQYLNNLAADEAIILGRRIVLNSIDYNNINDIPADKIATILKETEHKTTDELFRDIALGNELCLLVIQKVLGQKANADPSIFGLPTEKKFPIRGTYGLLINFAHCCQPVPGDEIVAQVTVGKGLIIHCSHCQRLKLDIDQTKEKFIQVEWDEQLVEQIFQTSITIEYTNVVGILPHMLRIISDSGAIIGDMRTNKKDSTSSIMEMRIGVRDLSHLNSIMRALKIMPNIISVIRCNGNIVTSR